MRNPAAKSHRHAASWLLLASFLIGTLVNAVYAQDATGGTDAAAESAPAQQSADEELIIRPIRTDSPRSTLSTFLRLRDELEENLLAYRANKTQALADQGEVILAQLIALLDLSSVSKASRREVGTDTMVVLLDIFGRVELPNLDRIYALTHDWNEFHAIREDVFLRVSDIVKASGTGFAFPLQTLYMGRDEGLDNERGASAVHEIQSLRRAGKLPFPRLAPDRIEQLEDTLDYPPRGSIEAGSPALQEWETSESLSVEPHDEDEDELKPATETERR